MRRIIQLRALISVGCDAIGTSTSIAAGYFRPPDPGVHAAHRIADHQSQMPDAEPFHDQPVLRIDDVVIVVFRKRGLQAVGGFR
jgi:hypothetical protein